MVSQAAGADSWADGTEAFERNDYKSALTHFIAARDQGMTGPAVHYNIAVAQYQLGRYRDSINTFQLISNRYPKMRGLAEYNLGLAERRLGNSSTAIRHFIAAYRNSRDNEKIRILASHQVRELEPEMRTASSWSGAFGIAAGFDDNVTLRDTSTLSSGVTTETPTAELFASIKGPYSGRNGIRFEGDLYLIKNLDVSDFDQTEVAAGLFYDWRGGDWRIQAGIHGGAGTLGGDAFDQKAGANLRATRYLNDISSITFQYYYDDIRAEDDLYVGIEGTRQQFQARYQWYPDDEKRLIVRVRHDYNDRLDPSTSPVRTGISADYRYQPVVGWGFEVGAAFRTSRYDGALLSRTEDRARVRAGITRSLPGNWRLLLDYRFTNNQSSDPVFEYDRSVAALTLMRFF